MSASTDVHPPSDSSPINLTELPIADIEANSRNPRLEFPQSELDRLSDSIDLEGVLVPIVVYQRDDGKYVLVDGERRFRCARDLGHELIPAVITAKRSDLDELQQMFNIHLIREPWNDYDTAQALKRLSEQIHVTQGTEPNDNELRDRTGLKVERVRQLRYAASLPSDWQEYLREGKVPLNYFWELKKVVDSLSRNRPTLATELGEHEMLKSFLQKRLDGVVTDTVSLRKIAPIIRFARAGVGEATEPCDVDETLRDLFTNPQTTIDDAYEETVAMWVEVDKLGRRTKSMLTVFQRLLEESRGSQDYDNVVALARDLADGLNALVGEGSTAD